MAQETNTETAGIHRETSRFILSFIQALLKSGYYTPSHPEASRAKAGLYNDLLSILKGHKEITFIAVTMKERRDVLVDGVFDEPVSVGGLMLKGMAEMFVPKFLEYFDRKNLSSFSIKANITRDEFESFIDIMSESPFQKEERTDTRERLTLELIKNNVLNVSTIFNIDLVGRERRLPWRVEIALTRLKRDLSLIPLYKNLSEDKKAEIKHMVFDDIVRPIKSPEIIRDIIVNMDLISSDIPEISKEEFEDRVTDFIHKDYLLLAAPGVLRSFIGVKESYEKLHHEGIPPRLAFLKEMSRKVGLKIIGYGFSGEGILMDYFNHGVLTVDELPENLMIKVKRKEMIEGFLKEPQRYFIALEKAEGQETEKIASLLLNLLPELVARGLYTEAEEILKNIGKAGFGLSDIDSMLMDEIISSMEKKIDEGTPEEQRNILGIIGLMDKTSIVVLMNLLTHRSRLVRKIACEMLIRYGKAVIPPLMKALERRKDWYFIRNALMILGEVGKGSAGLKEIFKRFLNYEEPRVRVEAVGGIVNVVEAEAEELLINALKDRDHTVRRKAVWALGRINSLRPEVINYFIDTIKGRQEEDESIIEQVLSSIETYPSKPDEMERFEEAILEALVKGHGILSRFITGHIQSDHLRAKMCETLGYIGSDRSIDLLKRISKKDDGAIKEKALEAIERIRLRT